MGHPGLDGRADGRPGGGAGRPGGAGSRRHPPGDALPRPGAPGPRATRRPPQGGGRPEDARGHPGATGHDPLQVPRGARRPAREDAAQRARRRHGPARRLSGRAGDLREPARAPRHGEPLPARGRAAVPGRPRPLRPRPERQGGRDVPAHLHPAGQERDGRPLLRPDRPGRAVQRARRAGQGRVRREHDRAHDGRHRRPARRPERGGLSGLGRHPQPRLPRRAAPRSTRPGSAARATRAGAR